MSQDNFNVQFEEGLLDECLIAKKIYGRCKQQDCLKPCNHDDHHKEDDFIKIDSSLYGGGVNNAITNVDVLSGPPSPGNSGPLILPQIGANPPAIYPGEVIRFDSSVKSIEICNFKTEVKVLKVCPSGAFSMPGFYDVTIQYVFHYELILKDIDCKAIKVIQLTFPEQEPGQPTPQPIITEITAIPAYTTYCKIITLEGGVVDANTVVTITDTGVCPTHNFVNPGNVPYVYVQTIANPLLVKQTKESFPTNGFGGPTFPPIYTADVVIGLFTIIELYRITNMTVASNGPIEIPQCQPSIINDPCVNFNQLLFPYDDFDPPYRKC